MQVRLLPGRPFCQGVGESARPRLPWKQEIGGWNPPALTNSALVQRNGRPALNRETLVRSQEALPNVVPWRNRNAAVRKTAMSRGSTGRHVHIQESQSDECRAPAAIRLVASAM